MLQGNGGSVLNIRCSKLILVTRCKKREQRENGKQYKRSSLEAIQIQTLLILRCMKYQLLLKYALFFSFMRPSVEIVTRRQQGSLQRPTHADAALPAHRRAVWFAEKELGKAGNNTQNTYTAA